MSHTKDSAPPYVIESKIWEEEAEQNNPFAAHTCHCHGYNVYGDLLGKASWIEYLLLLFKGQRPTISETQLIEGLAVALANPGPRDHSVQAAMNGGAGGSGNAACLMAALAVGAGNLNGGREIYHAIQYWQRCGQDLELWQHEITAPTKETQIDVWPEMEHTPGFDPNGVSCPTPVLQTLEYLTRHANNNSALSWLTKNRTLLEDYAKSPFAMSGVAAATLFDLEFDPEQAEMLYLMLRLPGAAIHALETKQIGHKKFPAFNLELQLLNDLGGISDNH